MLKSEILEKLEAQKRFFAEGRTLPVSARLDALRRLRAAILSMEGEISAALKADLGKSASESYLCETGMALAELTHMLRHARRYARPRRVPTPLSQFPARSRTQAHPYGAALIMSPWNYPFLLSLDPVIDAVAAGNVCMVKPSAYSPASAEMLKKLLGACFPEEWVCVVPGGREENAFLLDCAFDKIFFTGGVAVGRLVMEKAAAHLTPVTLELGGKSPCIVDETADVAVAAKRIVFGKFLNCGQTCVAPDYVYCAESVREPLIAALKAEIVRQYGARPLENENYGRIVNRKHFDRLLKLISPEKVVHGGGSDPDALRIEPTILDRAAFDDPAMGEEIFGPVLPVLTYGTLDEALRHSRRAAPSAGAVLLQPRPRGAGARDGAGPVRRRLRQRHHRPSGHLGHALRRRGRQRHGRLSRPRGLRRVQPCQEHRR